MTSEEIAAIIGTAASKAPELLTTFNSNRTMYPQCGTRPLFIGKRRKHYDACVASSINTMPNFAQNNEPGSQSPTMRDNLKSVFPLLLIAGVGAAYYYNKKSKK